MSPAVSVAGALFLIVELDQSFSAALPIQVCHCRAAVAEFVMV